MLADALRFAGQITTAVEPARQFRNAWVFHAGTQQRAAANRLPMGQWLLAHRGIGIAQAAVQICARAGLVERLRHVIQADGGKGIPPDVVKLYYTRLVETFLRWMDVRFDEVLLN